MKIRIKFAKRGAMKFIGHLDIMRYFQKAIRRADIAIKYSEGYSPHQIMSFAAPLGVGLVSEGEYFDIEVSDTLSSAESVKRLNDTMVDGMEILSYRILDDDAKNAMSIVAAADYEVNISDVCGIDFDLATKVQDFYNQESIVILKKTKKSEKEIDIKPLIYKLNVVDNTICMQLATGSVYNLKPELVMEAFFNYANCEYDQYALQIRRMEVYADVSRDESKRELVTLENLGEEIG